MAIEARETSVEEQSDSWCAIVAVDDEYVFMSAVDADQ